MGRKNLRDVRMQAIQMLKDRGSEGVSAKELAITLKLKSTNLNIFNATDMVYEEKRGGALYYIWCGK